MSSQGRIRLLGLVLVIGLTGCQGRIATLNYTGGFEKAILRMYEEHVLANLARRAEGRFIVQMSFSSFASNVAYTGSTSGQLDLFKTRDIATEAGLAQTTVALNPSFWRLSPSVGSSLTGAVGFIANPATHQAEVLAVYDAEVGRPEIERIFGVTTKLRDASKAYRSVRLGLKRWAIVPKEKTKEFCDFVSKVSFYSPDSPTSRPAPE